MVFWRKKKNPDIAEEDKSAEEKRIEEKRIEEKREEQVPQPETELPIDPPVETQAEPDLAPISPTPVPEPEPADAPKHDLRETEAEIIEDLQPTPVPQPIATEVAQEGEELADDSEKGGWLSRLTSGLSKSSSKITQGLSDLITKKKLDQEMLDELEEVLITADLGPKTASKIVWEFSQGRFGTDISEEEVKLALAESVSKILDPVAQPLNIEKPKDGPFVILVCGVNGAGKTTTIGKMAHNFAFTQKKKVMLAAGDTFRAAAVEQLKVWAERVHCPILTKDIGADAAAVAFESYDKAKAEGADILMIDTAGRLQNKSNLMDELQKIVRVLKKQDENIPHAVLLVLDATTGQNAFSQVETFKDMVNVTGLIVTKLDGTAKGGVLVGLADQFGIPVHAVGVGEKIEDLAPFKAQDFANSLMDVG